MTKMSCLDWRDGFFYNCPNGVLSNCDLLPIKLSYHTWDSCSMLSISIGIVFVT
jgi:hypothetical protein